MCNNFQKSSHSSGVADVDGTWGGLGKLADDVKWIVTMENKRRLRRNLFIVMICRRNNTDDWFNVLKNHNQINS